MTKQPLAPRVRFDALPALLIAALRWVLWRYTWDDEREEWGKVPYRISGRKASSTDPSTWATLAAVREAYEASLETAAPYSGVGFVVWDGSEASEEPPDDFLGLDLDGCIDADGRLMPWAENVLARLPRTYTEVTPSGTGLRLFFRGALPEGVGNKVNLEGAVPSVPGPKRPELEWYTTGRYLTSTGHVWGDAPADVADVDADALLAVWAYVKGLTKKAEVPRPVPSPSLPLTDDDDVLLDRIRRSKHGAEFADLYDRGDTSRYGGDDSRAAAALVFRLAFWTGGDAARMDRLFRASALMRPKWDSRRGDSTWGALEIERAIAQVSEHYAGTRSERRTAERDGHANAHVSAERVAEQVAVERAVSMRWQPFPVDDLPPEAADYARAHAAAIGCDVAFVAAPILGVLGAAVGNSYRAGIKQSWDEVSAAWIGVVGESGSGKSPGLDAAALPVYLLESEARRAYEEEREEYEGRLERWSGLSKAEKASTPKPSKPERQRRRTSDVTLEGLAMLHGDAPRGLAVVRDELGGWVAGMNQYKRDGADVQGFIEMWGGRPLVIDRKTGDRPVIYVERPNVTVVGGIQPAVLRDRISAEMIESGFLARLLLLQPPERPLPFTDADVTPAVRDAYCELVYRTYARPDGGPILPLSRAAREGFRAFVDENAARYAPLSGALRSALVKLPSYAARFALALHVADAPVGVEPGPISAEAMERAGRLVRWFRYETARLYALNGYTAAEDRDTRLARALPATFTWEDVRALWEVERSAAYDTIRRLVKKGHAEEAGRGTYRRLLDDAASSDRTPDFPDLPDEMDGRGAVSPVCPVRPASGALDPGGDGVPPPEAVTFGPPYPDAPF